MSSTVSNPVFSVPFRHLSSPQFSCDQVLTESSVSGILRFVGDRENELLKYLNSDHSFTNFEWPLVLFGSTGTGKTALALTVISMLSEKSSPHLSLNRDSTHSSPTILTAPDFIRRFNSAIATDSVADFRERIVSSSAVLIDNVHLLTSSPHTQKELVYLVDQLLEKRIPMVFTSHFPPHSIPNLSVQLNSRMTGGLSILVQAPGPAARRELILDLIRIHGFKITADAVNWLVDRLQLTVPKMNQFFSQLRLRIQTEPATTQLDLNYFKTHFQTSSREQISEQSKTIIQLTAKAFHLKPADLEGTSRKQSIVQARGVAIFLCREFLDASFKKIGSWFGNKDHSTIMHAYNKTRQLIEAETNNVVRTQFEELHKKLVERFANELSFQSNSENFEGGKPVDS